MAKKKQSPIDKVSDVAKKDAAQYKDGVTKESMEPGDPEKGKRPAKFSD